MSVDAVRDLADQLRSLKERTGRSYQALASRTGVSRSTLHRYCSGMGVPVDFEAVSRLARVCGADRDELLELHRRWALASAMPRSVVAVVPASIGQEPGPPVVTAAPQEPCGPGAELLVTRHWALLPYLVAGCMVVALFGAFASAAMAGTRGSGSDAVHQPPLDGPGGAVRRALFSPACPAAVSIGRQDQCVREVQTLLAEAGTVIKIDAAFGPQTQRRVLAFQVLAGLPADGVVDDATKRELYAGRVSLWTWVPDRVERRIREVFYEQPDLAVRVARCQSFLDPLWVSGNADGSRSWGLFQMPDQALRRYAGTTALAFDPEWNIQAAHRIWAETGDFRHWRACPTERGPRTSAATVIRRVTHAR